MITIVSIICLTYINISIPQRRNNRYGIISIPITRCNAVFRIGIYTLLKRCSAAFVGKRK